MIKNKWIFPAFGISFILNSIYYGIFVSDLIILYLVNIFASTVLSLLIYKFHFWGAGDSKLLILIASLIPARLYYDALIPIPTLVITVFTFAIAFLYLVIEAITLGIKDKTLLKLSSGQSIKKRISGFVYGYIASYAYISLISIIETFVFKDYIRNGSYIFILLNFFVVLTVFSFQILKKWYIIVPIMITDVVLMLVLSDISIKSLFSVKSIIIVAVVMIFREIADKYNYKEIKTDDIKEGQILSFKTVLCFNASKVKGLPITTTEDFRSRITSEQAESIKKWKNSKNGQDTITIVRKLPFAIFITIGTIAFVMLMRLSV